MSAFATAVLPRYAEARPEIFVPRAEIPPAMLAAEADTIGWDVVHALRLPQVNATLQASGRYPSAFEYDVQPGWRIAGRFRPWLLVRGGSNSILFVRAPLAEASLVFPGVPDLQVRDGSVTVAVKLNYLPQPPPESGVGAGAAGASGPRADGGGDPQYLAARSESPSPDDPPAVVQAVDYGTGVPSALQDALFRAAVGKWFNQNLDQLSYVFCALDINARAAQGDFQWLKPTYTGYAYANGPTEELSTFGVLTMTSGNDPQGRVNQVAPAAVPPGCTASVLVSQGSFLRHLMLPGLTRALTGTAESDFAVDAGGSMLQNTRAIDMDEIESDGTRYRPVLIELRLQVVGDELQLKTKVKINVSPGIDAFVVATDYFRIVLVSKPDGGQTLDFATSRPTTRNDYTEKAEWVTITEIIIGIIGAVVAIVAGIVIPGAGAALVAVLLISLVAGLAAATPSLIAAVAGGKAAAALPSIGDFLTECTAEIHWPQAAGLDLTVVELNGSLQLGGHLRPLQERAR